MSGPHLKVSHSCKNGWINILESNNLEVQAGDGRIIMHWIWKLGVYMRNFIR
jgi:hypothetical protein